MPWMEPEKPEKIRSGGSVRRWTTIKEGLRHSGVTGVESQTPHGDGFWTGRLPEKPAASG